MQMERSRILDKLHMVICYIVHIVFSDELNDLHITKNAKAELYCHSTSGVMSCQRLVCVSVWLYFSFFHIFFCSLTSPKSMAYMNSLLNSKRIFLWRSVERVALFTAFVICRRQSDWKWKMLICEYVFSHKWSSLINVNFSYIFPSRTSRYWFERKNNM